MLFFHPVCISSQTVTENVCLSWQRFLHLSAQKKLKMNTETSSSPLLNWVLFLVSTILLIVMLIWLPQWFWLALPFSLTFLVRAMNMM